MAGAAALHARLASMGAYVRQGDQIANLLAINSIAETGVPIVRPAAHSFHSAVNAQHLLYWEYGLELYLRTPFYLLRSILGEAWVPASALFCAYSLILFWLFTYLRCGGAPLISERTGALFAFLFGTSALAGTGFWFARYFPFVLLAMASCHVLCVRIHADRTIARVMRASLVLTVAFLPALFHLTATVYFLYWCAVVLGDVLLSRRTVATNAVLPGGRLVPTLAAGVVAAGVCALGYAVISANWVHLASTRPKHEVFQSFAAIAANVDEHTKLSAFLHEHRNRTLGLIAMFAGGALLHRTTPPFERRLVIHSLAAIAFCLTGFTFFGADRVVFESYRYFLFLLPLWFWTTSVLVSSIAGWLMQRRDLILLRGLGLAALVVVCVLQFRQEHLDLERLARLGLSREELDRFRSETLAAHPDTVFLTEDSTLFYVYFPKAIAYTLRSYGPDRTQFERNRSGTWLRRTLFFIDDNNEVRNIYGAVYIGSLSDFCFTMSKHLSRKVFIYNGRIGRVPDLEARLKELGLSLEDEPVPVSRVLGGLCRESVR